MTKTKAISSITLGKETLNGFQNMKLEFMVCRKITELTNDQFLKILMDHFKEVKE